MVSTTTPHTRMMMSPTLVPSDLLAVFLFIMFPYVRAVAGGPSLCIALSG
mgnify:CR=1 FL=1